MPKKDAAHFDRKQNLSEPQHNLSESQKSKLLEKGSEWVNVTEIRMKYEVFKEGEKAPITYEIYLDPAIFDSYMASPRKCEQIDPDTDHILLSPDGTGPGWEELVERRRGKIHPPRPTSEPGRFATSHTPLCVHDESCIWYCFHF
jgi:hypothetical protein